MTQIEREELVERYLSGEMNSAEEADFFLHAAVDDELQRTLKAYRIMENAIRHDREVVVAERSRYREHIMGLLAITPVTAGVAGGASSTSGAAAGASAGTGSTGGGFFAAGLGLWKTIAVTVITGTVVAGSAMMILPKKGEQTRTAPAVSAPAGETPRMAPAIDSMPVETSPDAQSEDAAEEAPVVDETPAPRKDVRSAEPRTERAAKATTRTPRTSVTNEQESSDAKRTSRKAIQLKPLNQGDGKVSIEIQKPKVKTDSKQ